jgi:hypothetical protein
MKFRLAGASAVAALAAIAALAPAAAASPARPAAAEASAVIGPPITGNLCSGDACARVYARGGGQSAAEVYVRVWARSYPFYGHFELRVPGVRNPYNTGDATNYAGRAAATWEVPNNDGRFTVTAWQRTGPRSWGGIGSVSFNGAIL